jgi:hypothetical protein
MNLGRGGYFTIDCADPIATTVECSKTMPRNKQPILHLHSEKRCWQVAYYDYNVHDGALTAIAWMVKTRKKGRRAQNAEACQVISRVCISKTYTAMSWRWITIAKKPKEVIYEMGSAIL